MHDAYQPPPVGRTDSPMREAPAAAIHELPLPFDDWELDEQLRHIERVLHGAKVRARPADVDQPRHVARYDAAHAGPPAWHMALAEQQRQRRSAPVSPRKARGLLWSLVTWLTLLMGTTGLVCGCGLLGWSLTEGRPELWNIGLPLAAMGQVALLVGLVLQIDGLWHHSHETVAKLDSVDAQLHDIKTSTELLGATQNPVASTFYAHLAHGAGPQVLLTDLKSQIDLLAMKIAQDER
jgi:hypothetical protein